MQSQSSKQTTDAKSMSDCTAKDRDQEELPPVVLSTIKTKEGVSDSRALRDSNLGMIEEVAVLDLVLL